MGAVSATRVRVKACGGAAGGETEVHGGPKGAGSVFGRRESAMCPGKPGHVSPMFGYVPLHDLRRVLEGH